jgi:hypothetical protein
MSAALVNPDESSSDHAEAPTWKNRVAHMIADPALQLETAKVLRSQFLAKLRQQFSSALAGPQLLRRVADVRAVLNTAQHAGLSLPHATGLATTLQTVDRINAVAQLLTTSALQWLAAATETEMAAAKELTATALVDLVAVRILFSLSFFHLFTFFLLFC